MEVEIVLENEITRGDWHIYIEPNPDRYRGGLIWSLVNAEDIWDEGLAWSKDDALLAAHDALSRLNEQHQEPRLPFDT